MLLSLFSCPPSGNSCKAKARADARSSRSATEALCALRILSVRRGNSCLQDLRSRNLKKRRARFTRDQFLLLLPSQSGRFLSHFLFVLQGEARRFGGVWVCFVWFLWDVELVINCVGRGALPKGRDGEEEENGGFSGGSDVDARYERWEKEVLKISPNCFKGLVSCCLVCVISYWVSINLKLIEIKAIKSY